MYPFPINFPIFIYYCTCRSLIKYMKLIVFFFPHAVIPTNVPPIKLNFATWPVLSVVGCKIVLVSGGQW